MSVVPAIYKQCEPKDNWAGFELFLNTLFAEGAHPSEWALFVQSCFDSRNRHWIKRYADYLDGKPKLKLGMDSIIAHRHLTEGNYKKAAELYEDILGRCGPEDDKVLFKFQLCKCLFYEVEPRRAIHKLASFIADHDGTRKGLVKEAMQLQAQAHIQLSEPDKAMECFSAMMAAHPETKQTPETDFFLGYCFMLQGKFPNAEEAFERVLKNHPDSPYARKARMCMERIEAMT
jgi:tetratricopeptide (TPR) repeat protein